MNLPLDRENGPLLNADATLYRARALLLIAADRSLRDSFYVPRLIDEVCPGLTLDQLQRASRYYFQLPAQEGAPAVDSIRLAIAIDAVVTGTRPPGLLNV